MAIFNLTTPPNGTPGGTWAIANTTECGCASPNGCGATLTTAGILDVIVPDVIPAVPCIVYVTYTVVNGTCSDVSVHQITVNLKSCISFSNSATSDWELHLNPLTIDNTIVTDPFVYAVVPTTAVCGDYTGAIAWGYKGNCGYPLPSDLTPKANFATSNNEQTFQVPAGDYKVVIACVGNTVLSDCEKIECCEYEITVADLNLCSVYSPCAPLGINYPLNPANFTINIPMVVDQDKCVRMDFNGGGAVADTIQLQVLTTTGWEYVELDPLNINADPLVDIYEVSTSGGASIVVRAATTALIPGTSYLPANSILFGAQYKLNWVVSRAGSNGTSWSCSLSCCDCLTACPPVQYSCITNVVEIPVPDCLTGCANWKIEGNYSRSVGDIKALIGGSCSPNLTCLGSLTSNSNNISSIGIASLSSPAFTLLLAPVDATEDTVIAGTLCADNRYELPLPITYTHTTTQNIIDYGDNGGLYTQFKNMILGLPADKSNLSLTIASIGSSLICNDSMSTFVGLGTMYFVENGVSASFSWNDADNIVTIDFPITPALPFTCVSSLEIGSPKPELFHCKPAYAPFGPVTGTIALTSTHAAVYELRSINSTNSIIGNYGASQVCPALYEVTKFIVMDPTDPVNTWIYVKDVADGPTCPPLFFSPSVIIYQHAAGLDPNLSYGNFDPINSGGCVGWRDMTLFRNYTIAPGTGVGFNDCYNPI